YGKHLQGSDTKENGHVLEGLDFDKETREMLGLDDIEEILGQIDKDAEADIEEMEAQAQAVKEGSAGADIRDPDEVIEEMDQEMESAESAEFNPEDGNSGSN
ncbi:MAG: phosphoesterase, partial [Haloarculaceae archaeon]